MLRHLPPHVQRKWASASSSPWRSGRRTTVPTGHLLLSSNRPSRSSARRGWYQACMVVVPSMPGWASNTRTISSMRWLDVGWATMDGRSDTPAGDDDAGSPLCQSGHWYSRAGRGLNLGKIWPAWRKLARSPEPPSLGDPRTPTVASSLGSRPASVITGHPHPAAARLTAWSEPRLRRGRGCAG